MHAGNHRILITGIVKNNIKVKSELNPRYFTVKAEFICSVINHENGFRSDMEFADWNRNSRKMLQSWPGNRDYVGLDSDFSE